MNSLQSFCGPGDEGLRPAVGTLSCERDYKLNMQEYSKETSIGKKKCEKEARTVNTPYSKE